MIDDTNEKHYVVLSRMTPQSAMITEACGLPVLDPIFSTDFTTPKPLNTCPKTTCLPSSHGQETVVMKN